MRCMLKKKQRLTSFYWLSLFLERLKLFFMTYTDLKKFCDSLSEEQLKQEVFLTRLDDSAIKVVCGHVTEEDIYFEHCDALGNLEQIKQDNPEDWQEIIEDSTLVPKGTVTLCDE